MHEPHPTCSENMINNDGVTHGGQLSRIIWAMHKTVNLKNSQSGSLRWVCSCSEVSLFLALLYVGAGVVQFMCVCVCVGI